MTLTRADLAKLTLADLQAMSPEAHRATLDAIVDFWRENERAKELRDQRMVGSTPSYKWGE
jgi:hypothetical protein